MFPFLKFTPKLALVFFLLSITSGIIFHQRQLWGQKDLQQKVKQLSDSADLIKKQKESNLESKLPIAKQQKAAPPLRQNQLKQIAESVTVRIFADSENSKRGGSGVLIGSRKGDYLVVTNNHVVSDTNLDYKIETHKGNIYPAQIIWQNNQDLTVDDLALLKFTSQEQYQTIPVKDAPLIQKNQMVFASGFPFERDLKQSKELNYTVGNITMILPQPLKGGYQLGYTNSVQNGMSGGSIINLQGELIGINGLGKYPVLGNPYIYQDGREIAESETEAMSELSWGIPSKNLNQLINRLLENYKKNSGRKNN
jgi:S1-C subfamily serine protease